MAHRQLTSNNRFQPTASLREAAAEPGRWAPCQHLRDYKLGTSVNAMASGSIHLVFALIAATTLAGGSKSTSWIRRCKTARSQRSPME